MAHQDARSDSEVQQSQHSVTQPRHVTHSQPAASQPRQAGALKFANLEQLEGLAKLKLSANAYGYYASGSESGSTMAANRAAFLRLRLLPRMMVDVSTVDTSMTLLGAAELGTCFGTSHVLYRTSKRCTLSCRGVCELLVLDLYFRSQL